MNSLEITLFSVVGLITLYGVYLAQKKFGRGSDEQFRNWVTILSVVSLMAAAYCASNSYTDGVAIYGFWGSIVYLMALAGKPIEKPKQ